MLAKSDYAVCPGAGAGVVLLGERRRADPIAEPVRVSVRSGAEGRDLIAALATRGLNAGLVQTSSGEEVVVSSPRETNERLLLEVALALELWLRDRRRPSIRVQVGESSLTLRPSAAAASTQAQFLADRERHLAERTPAEAWTRRDDELR